MKFDELNDLLFLCARMRELLACYTNQEYLVLGLSLFSTAILQHLVSGLKTASLSLTGEGVTFPTGGAGTVFNRAAVRTFVGGGRLFTALVLAA